MIVQSSCRSQSTSKDLKNLWQKNYRARIHELAIWDNSIEMAQENNTGHLQPSGKSCINDFSSRVEINDDIQNSKTKVRLTYVASGFGISGWNDLSTFVSRFPTNQHPFAQNGRFVDDIKSTSISCDPDTRIVIEEFVLSAVHNAPMDYIVPGMPVTNKAFTVNFVAIAQYSPHSDKLVSANFYWDASTVMSQLGSFEYAFNTLIRAKGDTAFNVGIESLSLAEGPRVAAFLANQSAESILPKTISSINSNNSKGSKPHNSRVLSPISGLDSVAVLAHDLPIIERDVNTKPIRQPVFSSVFAEQRELINFSKDSHEKTTLSGPNSALYQNEPNLSIVNNRDFLDEKTNSTITNSRGRSHYPVPKSLIFDNDESNEIPLRPSISIDPSKNKGHGIMSSEFDLIKEETKSFVLKDTSRFDSHVFSTAEQSDFDPTNSNCLYSRKPNVQLQSQGFSNIEVVVEESKSADLQSLSHRGMKRTPNTPNLIREGGRKGLVSSTLVPVGDNLDNLPNSSFMNPSQSRAINVSHLKSNITFGDTSDVVDSTLPINKLQKSDPRFSQTEEPIAPRGRVGSYVGKHNVSSLILGDAPPQESAPRPSSRVLQQPGGPSTVFS